MAKGKKMNRLLATKLWLVLVIYALGGLSLGLADKALGRVFQEQGVRPGMATFMTVNVLLPLLTISLGVVHPRIIINWLGTVVMTVAFILGLATLYLPQGAADAAAVVAAVPPVLVLAFFAYLILGTAAVVLTRVLSRPGSSGWPYANQESIP
jgi:hypothetical protein